MRRCYFVVILTLLLVQVVPPLHAQQAVDDLRSHPPARPEVQEIVRRMSVADRVGQLFMVTFVGDDTGPGSDIADLIATYRVGGVLLLASNENFRNEGNTPAQVVSLTNRLQALAYHYVLPPEHSLSPSPGVLTPVPPRPIPDPQTSVPMTAAVSLPLFIAIDQEGDGPPFTRLYNGFTPLPSNMAIGATWDPAMARVVGRVVGQELAAVGVNMLLGPSLDVVDTPRPGLRGDFGARSFGGDPYWVGRIGSAYIAGVHEGGQGRVLTVAKHFPGQGSADRRPDEEVATVAKSLAELRKIELAPFAEVTRMGPSQAITITDGLLSSHIRYQGFQGNIRERTPPISLAPELQDILSLPEFQRWRQEGGILLTDALGAQAIRRYKDPKREVFPYKQVALEAFLAGNDLLLLSQFSLSGTYKEQLENTIATITFFQEKYLQDATFRDRVDQVVTRIVARKLAMYPSLDLGDVFVNGENISERVGKGAEQVSAVARAAATLLHPGAQELADRLPAPPQAGEPILFISDDRPWTECPTCSAAPFIPPQALATITLSLYGPEATSQVEAGQVQTLSFSQLDAYLNALTGGSPDPTITELLTRAQWIIIAMTNIPPEEYPDQDVVSRLLAQGRGLLQDKRVIIFAFNAPYYLDATEISNVTAYYALYSKTRPFLETAVRLLFREFSPTGASPVSIPALNYDLRAVTEPAPNQVIALSIVELGQAGDIAQDRPVQLALGDTLTLRTSVILDRRGHPVPDGTPVVFRLFYPAESLEFRQEEVTRNGVAETSITLDRPGQLWITVSSLEAQTSTQLLFNIEPGEPGSVETVVPTTTPTVTPTPTPGPTPTRSPTPMLTLTPTLTPTPMLAGPPARAVPVRRLSGDALLVALLGLVLISGSSMWLWRQWGESPEIVLRWAAWEWLLGLGTYILFGLGALPYSTEWRVQLGPSAGGMVATVASFIPFVLWLGRRAWHRQRTE